MFRISGFEFRISIVAIEGTYFEYTSTYQCLMSLNQQEIASCPSDFSFSFLYWPSFLGVELISKVPSQLHTPLMSGTNAISGITIRGGLFDREQGRQRTFRAASKRLAGDALLVPAEPETTPTVWCGHNSGQVLRSAPRLSRHGPDHHGNRWKTAVFQRRPATVRG